MFNSHMLHKRYSNEFPLVVPTRSALDGFLVDTLFVWNGNGEFMTRSLRMRFESVCDSSVFVADPRIPNNGSLSGDLQFEDDIYEFVFSGKLFSRDSDMKERSADGLICLAKASSKQRFAQNLMAPYDLKIASFWVDTSVTARDVAKNPKIQTGELTFGARNENRYDPRSVVEFTLKSLFTEDDRGWETMNPVPVIIESNKLRESFEIIFDIGAPETLLPLAVYEAILGPLKKRVANPLENQALLPDELYGVINGFIGPSDKLNYFPCKYTKMISAFKLNNLLVLPEMLYEKVDNRQCMLRIASLSNNAPQKIVMGFHLIKQFHFSIVFDEKEGSTVHFATRIPATPRTTTCCAPCIIC